MLDHRIYKRTFVAKSTFNNLPMAAYASHVSGTLTSEYHDIALVHRQHEWHPPCPNLAALGALTLLFDRACKNVEPPEQISTVVAMIMQCRTDQQPDAFTKSEVSSRRDLVDLSLQRLDDVLILLTEHLTLFQTP